MNNNTNIEELFRRMLEDFQADVKPELWQAIQSKIAVGSAVGATAATKATIGGAKISSVIAIATSVITVSVFSVLIFNSAENKKVENGIQKINQPLIGTEKNNTQTAAEFKEKNETASGIETNEAKKPEATVVSAIKQPTSTSNEGASITENQKAPKGISNQNTGATTSQNQNEPTTAAVSQSTTPPSEKPNASSPGNALAQPNTEVDADKTPPETTNQDLKNKAPELTDYFGIIPNSFSPNFDGKNDIFMVHPKDVKSFTVTIFDRSGKQIHQWNNPNGFWDGFINNGQEAPIGNYYYMITGETMNGQIIKSKLSSLALFR